VSPKANDLFDALGQGVRERLRTYADLVDLGKGRVLSEAGDAPRHVFLPMNGMISLVAATEEGQTLEVARVGRDGFIGVPVVLGGQTYPCQVIVQIECASIRIRADAFAREFHRGDELHAIALTYVNRLIQQLVQSTICHSFHPLPRRLIRWLLLTRDCVQSDTIELTQEFIARMLGVSRPKLSQAFVDLERRQLIHQGYGRIHLIDTLGLQQSSCDCYRAPSDHKPRSGRRVR
jgi:CRP-like cAMP-binding protein